jgi:hypothetical protein
MAGAVLLISKTSSYLLTVSPLHNFADDALFGRAFLTPVRQPPLRNAHLLELPFAKTPVISAYQFLMLHKTMQ